MTDLRQLANQRFGDPATVFNRNATAQQQAAAKKPGNAPSPTWGTPAAQQYENPAGAAYGSPNYGVKSYGTTSYGTSSYGTPSYYGSPSYATRAAVARHVAAAVVPRLPRTQSGLATSRALRGLARSKTPLGPRRPPWSYSGPQVPSLSPWRPVVPRLVPGRPAPPPLGPPFRPGPQVPMTRRERMRLASTPEGKRLLRYLDEVIPPPTRAERAAQRRLDDYLRTLGVRPMTPQERAVSAYEYKPRFGGPGQTIDELLGRGPRIPSDRRHQYTIEELQSRRQANPDVIADFAWKTVTGDGRFLSRKGAFNYLKQQLVPSVIPPGPLRFAVNAIHNHGGSKTIDKGARFLADTGMVAGTLGLFGIETPNWLKWLDATTLLGEAWNAHRDSYDAVMNGGSIAQAALSNVTTGLGILSLAAPPLRAGMPGLKALQGGLSAYLARRAAQRAASRAAGRGVGVGARALRVVRSFKGPSTVDRMRRMRDIRRAKLGRGPGSRYTMDERLELMEHSATLGSQLWSGYQFGSTVPRSLLDRYDLRLATPFDPEYWSAPQPLYGAPFVLVPKAGGGRVRGGETTLVGERGPEIVRLPAGSDVIPAHRSRMLMERQTQRQPVPADDRELHVHQHLDGREIARSTVRNLDDEEQWGWR